MVSQDQIFSQPLSWNWALGHIHSCRSDETARRSGPFLLQQSGNSTQLEASNKKEDAPVTWVCLLLKKIYMSWMPSTKSASYNLKPCKHISYYIKDNLFCANNIWLFEVFFITNLAASIPHFLWIEIWRVCAEATRINSGQLPGVMVHKLSPWKQDNIRIEY